MDDIRIRNTVRKKIYLKLFYSILDWEWYSDANTFRVFIHLLLTANRKDKPYMGDTIHRGETLASVEFLADNLKLSIRNVRTALEHLKSTGEVTTRKVWKTSVIRVVNFDKYQSAVNDTDNYPTTIRQRADNEPTTPIDCNIVNNVRMGEGKTPHGTFSNVFLTDKELLKLRQSYPYSMIREYIDRISMYIESTGKEYKSHYAVILSWLRRDGVSTNSEREGNILE